MDQFRCFSPEALQFLSELRANNRREWFHANKQIYEATIKQPAEQFAAQMSQALAEMTHMPHSVKIYRIHRDVRFSNDKTPYNPHLRMSFIPGDCGDQPPLWHFGLSPDCLSLGCGVFQYVKAALERYRTGVAGPAGNDLMAIINDLTARNVRISEPELKRGPSGYASDHPHLDLLRRKGLTVWTDLTAQPTVTQAGLREECLNQFQLFHPVFRALQSLGT
ncbi:DUF2461 domain-containing protein [Ruegeria faecimaris]|uniref:DUF2461 domain-containing protein n=1 Tax=Ruegeria faecimaris TaxID=686389 RepID=UPI00232F2497|nr:DUF2461 domain-containing protein [Ruegeria faecimaris]